MRLKRGAMETIYIGVDFHARQQTICYLTTEGGEVVIHQLKHQDKDQVRACYAQFSGRVIVGWKPVVTAPGSKPCSKNSAAESGWGMPPRSGGEPAGARRTIGATRS